MGLCDAVPGVSGGTMALILGFYERLITALHGCVAALRPPWRWAEIRAAGPALGFLLPLGLGAGVALVLALRLLVGDTSSLQEPLAAEDAAALRAAIDQVPGLLVHPQRAPLILALFFGLVAASLGEPWRQRRQARRGDPALALAAALVAGLVALSPALDSTPQPWLLVIGGALAVTAMLLPGISGSLVLLLLGLYQVVAGAVNGLVASGSVAHLLTLLWFALGMGGGVMLGIPLLRRLLLHHHDRMMAILSGLMAGSLCALWPWKEHYLPQAITVLGPMHLSAPQAHWPWVLLCALLGTGIGLLMRHRRRSPEPC